MARTQDEIDALWRDAEEILAAEQRAQVRRRCAAVRGDGLRAALRDMVATNHPTAPAESPIDDVAWNADEKVLVRLIRQADIDAKFGIRDFPSNRLGVKIDQVVEWLATERLWSPTDVACAIIRTAGLGSDDVNDRAERKRATRSRKDFCSRMKTKIEQAERWLLEIDSDSEDERDVAILLAWMKLSTVLVELPDGALGKRDTRRETDWGKDEARTAVAAWRDRLIESLEPPGR